jgi:transcriptional regulator with XRE-family HTH domain
MKKEAREAIKRTFAERLTAAAAVRGMKKADVARALNMSQQRVGYYFNGKRLPDMETTVSLMLLFGVSLDYLFGLRGGAA